MKRHLAALFAIAISLATTRGDDHPVILPFEPAQLLSVLPAAPAEWKTLRSNANATLGEWLETRATRVFQAPPLPVAGTEAVAAAGKPGEIEITVVDTAGFAQSLAAFASFTPSKTGNLEKKLIGTLPAIIINHDDGQRFAQVLVSTRYVIELKLTNLPRHRVEDWLQGFHFDALPATSKAPATRPREFRLTHVDELQPKNNRSYAVSTTSAKRLDAFLKTLPPAPVEE